MLALWFFGGLVDTESHTSKAPSLFLVCCTPNHVEGSANETNGNKGDFVWKTPIAE
jgi:hypothetical protein